MRPRLRPRLPPAPPSEPKTPAGSTVEQEFLYYTAKVGDVSRALALGGIAIAWVFREPASCPSPEILSSALRAAVKSFVASLSVDALQYVLGTMLLWWKFNWTPDASVSKLRATANVLTFWIFVKVLLMGFGYVELARSLWPSLSLGAH